MLNKTGLLNRNLSARDLGTFGIEDLAYVKGVIVDGQQRHAIHAADGTQLTIVDDRNLAFVTVSQHDMQAVSVH